MTMINGFQQWLEHDDTRILYLLSLILVVSLLDFVLGWLNAKLNRTITFSSATALWGIIKKIVYFMLLIIFIPVALLFPAAIGLSALYILYIGYLLSELQSILDHFDDAPQSLRTFIQKIIKEVGK